MKTFIKLSFLIILSIFLTSCPEPIPDNTEPFIISATALKTTVDVGETTTLQCQASDIDGDILTYSWEAEVGALDSLSGSTVQWTAPQYGGEFTIRVLVSDGEAGHSITGIIRIVVEITNPPVSNFSIEEGNEQITLVWDNPSHYAFDFVEILRKTGNYSTGPGDGELVYRGTGESITDISLENGTQYYYSAFTKNISNEYSIGVTATGTPHISGNPPETPTGLTSGIASSSTIHLLWDSVSGALNYEVYRSDSSDGSYILVYSGNQNEFTDNGLTANSTYFYKVSASNNDGNSILSNFISQSTDSAPIAVPITPTGLSVGNGTSSTLELTWSTVTYGELYHISRYDSTSYSYIEIFSGLTNTYTDTNLDPDSLYFYKVSASNSLGESNPSAAASGRTSIQIDPPQTPTGLSGSNATSASIDLSWNSVSNAGSYQLYRADTSDGIYSQIYDGAQTFIIDSGLSADTTYYYKVEATNSEGTSVRSPAISATTDVIPPNVPLTPSNLSVGSETTSSLQISWDSVSDATSYQLSRSESANGSYTEIYNGSSAIYNDTGLEDDKNYYYKVRATNADGSSDFSTYATGRTSIIQYTLNVSAGTGGSVSPNGSSLRNSGSTVSLTATPDSGYAFVQWTGNVANINSASTTVTMNGNQTVSASFEQTSFQVTLDPQSGAGGTTAVTASIGQSMPSATAPTRTSYVFDGYYTSPNGLGNQYYSADMSSVQNWDVSSNYTLYAHWVLATEQGAVNSISQTDSNFDPMEDVTIYVDVENKLSKEMDFYVHIPFDTNDDFFYVPLTQKMVTVAANSTAQVPFHIRFDYSDQFTITAELKDAVGNTIGISGSNSINATDSPVVFGQPYKRIQQTMGLNDSVVLNGHTFTVVDFYSNISVTFDVNDGSSTLTSNDLQSDEVDFLHTRDVIIECVFVSSSDATVNIWYPSDDSYNIPFDQVDVYVDPDLNSGYFVLDVQDGWQPRSINVAEFVSDGTYVNDNWDSNWTRDKQTTTRYRLEFDIDSSAAPGEVYEFYISWVLENISDTTQYRLYGQRVEVNVESY